MNGTKSLSPLNPFKTDVERECNGIRTNWSSEERERRRRVAAVRQVLLAEKLLAQDANDRSRAA